MGLIRRGGPSRVLAWLVWCGYVCLGLMLDGLSGAGLLAAFFAVPLACALRPETMAYYGKFSRRDSLPPGMVFGLGWVMLLLPAILAGVVWLMS